MSDLFHKEIPDEYIRQVFDTMERADWHIYQILTKRSSLMRDFVEKYYEDKPVPPHIWLGVSIEDSAAMTRLRHLKQTNASMRFVSFEPLLGPIGKVALDGIHWVIVGGESGPGARPMEAEWARSLRDQCLSQRIAFFFKQWGGRTPKAGGNTLDGCQWQEYPDMVYDRVLEAPLQAAGAPSVYSEDLPETKGMNATGASVLTIGHSTHDSKAFVALLQRYGVTDVADVRSSRTAVSIRSSTAKRWRTASPHAASNTHSSDRNWAGARTTRRATKTGESAMIGCVKPDRSKEDLSVLYAI